MLTILSPVPPSFETEQSELFPDLPTSADPFQRIVTLKLDEALRAAKRAVTEAGATGRLDAFETDAVVAPLRKNGKQRGLAGIARKPPQ